MHPLPLSRYCCHTVMALLLPPLVGQAGGADRVEPVVFGVIHHHELLDKAHLPYCV